MKISSLISPAGKLSGLLCLALSMLAVPGLAQTVDPDPELFDGTRTKNPDAIAQQPQATVDDWEGANLILYDSDEEGSARGGQGRAGHDNPGMDIGVQGGGGMGGLQIPIPMGGGGGQGGGGLQIPQMELPESSQGGGPQGDGQQMPGGQSGPPPAGAQTKSGQKPGDIAIGDQGQRIQSTPMPVGDTEGLEKASENKTTDGGDDTQMKAASGAQSGGRGTGVEKGDAIPTDL